MTVECPKCGFVQPVDRYCANCGIDIENYRPAPRPLSQRVMESPITQMAAIFLLVIGASLFFLSQRSSQVFNNPSAFLEEEDEEVNAGESMESSRAAAYQQDPEPSPSPARAESAALETAAPVEEEEAPRAPEKLTIRFVQIPNRLLSQIFSDANTQIILDSASTRAIAHKSKDALAAWKAREPSLQYIGAGRTATIRPQTPIVFDWMHEGVPGTTEGWGLNLQITPGQVGIQNVELYLEGVLRLRNAAGAPQQWPIGAHLTFPAQDTLLIAGVLPRTPLRAEDQARFSETPISILSSPEYLEGSAEFAIVIQAK